MDVRFFFLFLFALVSCLPQAQVSRSNISNSSSTGGSGDGSIPQSDTNWNYLGSVSTSITINAANLNNAYLVGASVEKYLGTLSSSLLVNFDNANYCLVSQYTLGGLDYELRSRIVPISYYDFTAKRTVRILRVDFQDATNSNTYCSGTLQVQDSSGTFVTDSSTPVSSQFSASLVCPTCTSTLTATKVRLFKKESTLKEVSNSLINLGSLGLLIDPNNASNTNGGTCTNSECVSRGFNCCLDNQCVNDGAVKPAAASQFPSQLLSAEQERIQNPLAYLNYPQLYYICGTSVPTTTSGSSGGGSTDAAFTQLKKDYACVEHIKAQSTLSPFHQEILNRPSPYLSATDCLTATADAANTFYFQNVMKRLYATCGCAKTTLADMVAFCPAYEYTVVARDAANIPIQIDCYTPPNSGTVTIPSQRTINLNARSAPHRFFDNTGVERDISLGSTSFTQEGDAFSYLDDGKVIPQQQPFSMNAILGQMSVALDKALPAKTVPVEVDQVYLLSTVSGVYSPCPNCGNDSWLTSFRPYPSASTGVGLQSIGHSTERDSYSTNLTNGNYEDTIFGRACWIPPTMIPFSHSLKSTASSQRDNRLKTQSTLFANGYQRDWFGFNKGALIGSFDGVTWFAVGKGRIVRSTSKKLFLAINAPFADLANPNIHVVNVQAYDGLTQAAQVDYDPQYHKNHAYQNEAGNCQANHLCSTDTDCVTKLGWEYACADVKELRTNWPTFDVDGNEVANTSTNVTLDQILHQKRFPSSSSKRCVYRGSGSLCVINPNPLPDLNKKKLLTCAPNFYCSSVNTGAVFNSKIARYGAPLADIPVARNHLFGRDANVLGRPLTYMPITDGTSLLSGVRSTLTENLSTYESGASSATGLCLPGKALPYLISPALVANTNPFVQHTSADATKRADFISQIGSCNSTLFNEYRHTSCPVIGSDGNYEMFAASTLPVDYNIKATAQNACGLESIFNGTSLTSTADTLLNYSPFRGIEAKTLNTQVITAPTLARDACLRRAGAVCQTDLDCSPNKLHAAQVDFYSASYFGNGAERSYHTEYLVCGQADPKPTPSSSDVFKNYDMSKNRCCREVGLDLTTYTGDIPTSTAESLYDSSTTNLKMSLPPGVAPSDPQRYSRLATVENIGTSERPILSAYQDRDVANELIVNTQGVNVRTPNQWKTLSEANSDSCCGGGWIRKFSDGTNDWTKRDRVYVDVSSFACINSKTPLLTSPSDVAAVYPLSNPQLLVNQDYGDYCKDAVGLLGSCAQYSIANSTADTAPAADPYTTTVINTVNPQFNGANLDYFFKPRSADANSSTFIDYSSTSTDARRNITIKIPSYVSLSAFDNAIPTIQMIASDGSGATTCSAVAGVAAISSPTQNGFCGAGNCCYHFNPSTRVLKVVADTTPPAAFTNKRVGVQFTFATTGSGGLITRMRPGTNSYYLRRLARLELSGIPQISYEALYCSDNSNKLVPGIFRASVKTRAQFTDPSFSFISETAVAGVDTNFTNSEGLQEEPVFSSKDFKCCTPLGKVANAQSKCCSGFGIGSGTSFTCSLPAGTDLMVYFNRYVSNEGRGTEQPGGGLADADFDTITGEPLLSSTINQKISELGIAYCGSKKVRQGGAFGSYEPQPAGSETNLTSRVYNIVDSPNDNGQNSNAGTTINTGYQAFMDGFRWDNHLYCND